MISQGFAISGVPETGMNIPRIGTLIGIAGAKRSGKDTLARLLCERFRLDHLSFAAPIREAVAGILGATLDELEEHKERPVGWLGGVTPRVMMQSLGTEWGRTMIDPDIWVKSALRKATTGAVLSDVRFPNEAHAIHDRGGVIIRLHRGESNDQHASEQPLDASMIDCEINNTGSPADMLDEAVDFLLRRTH